MQADTFVGSFTTAITALASSFITVREAPRGPVVTARELRVGGEERFWNGILPSGYYPFITDEDRTYPPLHAVGAKRSERR